ncbi:MAG: magnesium chelatase domain-containing protein, partial [Planctomycetota bacterium]
AVAIHGAVSQKPFPAEAVAIGEVSLLGELRPTPQMTARLKEARAMGFRAAFVPPHTPPLDGLELVPVPFIGAVLGTHGLEEAQV